MNRRTTIWLVAATVVATCFAPLASAQASNGKHDETSTTSTSSTSTTSTTTAVAQRSNVQIKPVALYSTGKFAAGGTRR